MLKSCLLKLDDFRYICPFLSKTAVLNFANASVHSRLGFCESLFYGFLKYSNFPLKKPKIKLLASLLIHLNFLIFLQLSNLYFGFQYFIVLIQDMLHCAPWSSFDSTIVYKTFAYPSVKYTFFPVYFIQSSFIIVTGGR